MKKSKLFAPFLMLLAGAVACIVMFQGNYDTTELLTILLCVLIVFYAAGYFVQKKVVSFMDQIRQKEAEEAAREGEVIEKEALSEEEDTASK